ncbi:MAG: hypothetical protein HQL22_05235 [Candidatus Omnitrophica bacterium]|nr:hypothetical protein [Candidatus Omnitrophota bacterium]
MINADLINPRSLSETVRNDTVTELWMRYVCLSPHIRRIISKNSSQTPAIYARYARYTVLSLIALCAALAYAITVFIYHALPAVTGIIISFGFLFWSEYRGKECLAAITRELVTTLYADEPPKGTLIQFGEDLARKYQVTSFIDFHTRLDTFMKRFFIGLYLISVLIYINTNWTVLFSLLAAFFIWPLFLKPVRTTKALLHLA